MNNRAEQKRESRLMKLLPAWLHKLNSAGQLFEAPKLKKSRGNPHRFKLAPWNNIKTEQSFKFSKRNK